MSRGFRVGILKKNTKNHVTGTRNTRMSHLAVLYLIMSHICVKFGTLFRFHSFLTPPPNICLPVRTKCLTLVSDITIIAILPPFCRPTCLFINLLSASNLITYLQGKRKLFSREKKHKNIAICRFGQVLWRFYSKQSFIYKCCCNTD